MNENTKIPALGQPALLTDDTRNLAGWPLVEAFLLDIYGADAPLVWVTGFRDIEAGASWHGGQGLPRLTGMVQGDFYFCIGAMRPGADRRSNANVISQPLLIVDDIGTKIPKDRWDRLFAAGCPLPTFEIETSPNNWTFGWALAGGERAARSPVRWEDLTRIRAFLLENQLTDAVMDEARYIRLPVGWNSKEKYRVKGSGVENAPLVRLTAWRPGAKVDVDALGAAIVGSADWRNAPLPTGAGAAMLNSGQLGALLGAGALVRCATLTDPDAVILLADELGMNPRETGRGTVDALCPNMASHTSAVETGFAFLGNGLMHCHHGGCQHLRTPDFRAMMEDQLDAQIAARRAVGLPGPDGAASATEWIARTEARLVARRAGLTVEQDRQGAQAEADRMADEAAAQLGDEQSEGGGKKRAAHMVAADLMTLKGMKPFLDPTGGVWVWVNGRLSNLKTSAGLRVLIGWLAQHRVDVTGSARANLVDTLEGRAAALPTQVVRYRVANGGAADAPEIYLNLMDDAGNVVWIDGTGWRVMPGEGLPVHLAHREGGLPLPLPIKAHDGLTFMDRLARHVPLAQVSQPNDPDDEGTKQRAALLTFIVAQFVRTGMVPHLVLAGEQGGGKTTTAKRLNGLTDPDTGAARSSVPSDEGSLFAQAGQLSNFIVDNSSGVRKDLADALCVLATGGAYVARRLYTNGERSLSSALCSVIFTTVLDSGLTERPDLLDRIVPLATQPLPSTARRSEVELNTAWAADLPRLLSDLFDLLSEGLKHVKAVGEAQDRGSLPPPPRFVDAGRVAEAAAQHSLCWPPGLLTRSLDAARGAAARDQLSDDPVAFRLRNFLGGQPRGVWAGSYSKLEDNLRLLPGPVWPQGLTVKQGLPRVTGPMRDLWGIETSDARRKDARIKEFRLLGKSGGPDAAPGDGP